MHTISSCCTDNDHKGLQCNVFVSNTNVIVASGNTNVMVTCIMVTCIIDMYHGQVSEHT